MKKTKLFLTALISMFAFTCGVKAVEVKTAEELKTCLVKDGSVCTLSKSLENISTIDLAEVNATLDLNGNSITFAENERLNIKKGNFIIKGKGKISESKPSTAPVVIYGSINKTDTNYTTVTIEKDVILEGYYGSFISLNKDSNKVSHAYGTTVNINGTLKGINEGDSGAGFYINGLLQDVENAPVININSSANLNGNGGAIYAAGYAVWNIKDANLNGKEYGVALKAGKFNFNNTKIENNGEKKEGTYNGNGVDPAGATFQIESNNSYIGKIEINIDGGTYKSVNGDAIYHYMAQKEGTTEKVNNSLTSLSIKNGTFNGEINLLEEDTKNVTITGGTFNTDVTKFVGNKHIVNKNGNTYAVVENKVLETTDEKVIFESEEAIPNDFTLKVTEKTEDEIKKGTEKVTETYKDNKKVKEVKLINLYEIEILNGYDRVENLEDGKFTIAIAIPESEQKYDAYKVVYFDEDGKLVETLDAKLENGKVVFTTTHLSTYGIIGYNNVETNNPNTSDMNLALILTILGLASVGAVLVSRKKLAKANR